MPRRGRRGGKRREGVKKKMKWDIEEQKKETSEATRDAKASPPP
jgi:hypothetical protein